MSDAQAALALLALLVSLWLFALWAWRRTCPPVLADAVPVAPAEPDPEPVTPSHKLAAMWMVLVDAQGRQESIRRLRGAAPDVRYRPHGRDAATRYQRDGVDALNRIIYRAHRGES